MRLADATILVVDDEPELLDIFSIWLSRSGCTVLKAENGAEAIKTLTTQKVNALISDIRMPVMDGVTLVRTIAEMKLGVPSIIFVSGFGEVDAREAYSLGVEAMLPKPLGRKTLMQALEACLQDRHELWRIPLPTVPAAFFSTVLPSLGGTQTSHLFQLGRGGCTFLTKDSFAEETDLRLSVEFSGESTRLEGQARVRWFDQKDLRMGVEFLYLEDQCRDWVVDQIVARAVTAFIPHG